MDSVEASLLYDGPAEVDGAALAAAMAARVGGAFDQVSDPDDADLVFEGGGVLARVAVAPVRVTTETFETALKAPITQMNFPEASARAAAHTRHIFVEVEALPHQPNTDETEMTPFLTAFRATEHLVSVLHEMAPPLATHWRQSNMILPPKLFADGIDPTGLKKMIHPGFFSDGSKSGSVQSIGFHALGSSRLLGVHLIFEEAYLEMERYLNLAREVIWAIDGMGVAPEADTDMYLKSESVVRFEASEPQGFDDAPCLKVFVELVSGNAVEAPQRSAEVAIEAAPACEVDFDTETVEEIAHRPLFVNAPEVTDKSAKIDMNDPFTPIDNLREELNRPVEGPKKLTMRNIAAAAAGMAIALGLGFIGYSQFLAPGNSGQVGAIAEVETTRVN